jgi:hypothetical protein
MLILFDEIQFSLEFLRNKIFTFMNDFIKRKMQYLANACFKRSGFRETSCSKNATFVVTVIFEGEQSPSLGEQDIAVRGVC